MSRRMGFLLCLTVLSAGCNDEPMTDYEINYQKLHSRPEEIDTSQVELFEIEINGEDGFTGHPQVVAGEPMAIKGQIDLKAGVLTDFITGHLRVAYCKVEGGTADWPSDPSTYREMSFGNALQLRKKDSNKIDSLKTNYPDKPGLYELRYYLLLKKFRPDQDYDNYVGNYHLADGQFEILPADNEDE